MAGVNQPHPPQDQHDTLILVRPGAEAGPSAAPSGWPAAPSGWPTGPSARVPSGWEAGVPSQPWRVDAPQAPIVVIQRNDAAVVGATLGSLALFMSVLPLIGILAWVIAPIGLVSSALGVAVGSVRRVGRVGAWWGLLTSSLALAICVGWVLLLLAL